MLKHDSTSKQIDEWEIKFLRARQGDLGDSHEGWARLGTGHGCTGNAGIPRPPIFTARLRSRSFPPGNSGEGRRRSDMGGARSTDHEPHAMVAEWG